jgi:hypothetical protein
MLQAVLEGLGGCLLSHSVHVDETLGGETEVPDTGMLMDMYGQRGLDFVVDIGRRTVTATSVSCMLSVKIVTSKLYCNNVWLICHSLRLNASGFGWIRSGLELLCD